MVGGPARPQRDDVARRLDLRSDNGGWLLFTGAGVNLLSLALPLAILLILDRALPSRSLGLTAAIVVGAAVALVLDAALRIARTQFGAWSAARFEHNASTALGQRLLDMPLSTYEAAGTGEYLDRFREASTLKGWSNERRLDSVEVPFVILQLAVLAAISPWLAVVLLGLGAVHVFVTGRSGSLATTLTEERLATDARRTNFLVETLRQIHTVKAMSMELIMLRRYERLQDSTARTLRRLAAHLSDQLLFNSLFSPLASAVMTAIGAVLVVRGDITSGELAASLFVSFRALTLLQGIGARRAKRLGQAATLKKLEDTLAAEGPSESETGLPVPRNSPLGVRFEGVRFSYPGAARPVVDGLSFEVAPGEVLLLKGPNGSGRSTLLRLIAGGLAQDAGRVSLVDASGGAYSPERARPAVAFLPQQTTLFEGTLLDNVTLFQPARTAAALRYARDLGLDAVVQSLPKGWETSVGGAAAEAIPPGLRQLIGVVRALAQEPGVLLFDDATSSVDSRGDAAVIAALTALKGKATIVLVTQRPSLQRLADRVVELAGPGVPEAANTQTAAAPPPSLVSDVQGSDDFWAALDGAVMGAFSAPTHLPRLLTPLLRELGWQGAPRDVAEALPFFEADLDAVGLSNTLARLGFAPVERHVRLSEIDVRGLPCVFLPEGGEPRLITSARPPAGDAEGLAIFFRRRDADGEAPVASWSANTFSRMTPALLRATALSFATSLLVLMGSLFTLVVYDKVLPSGAVSTLGGLIIGLFLALLVAGRLGERRSAGLGVVAGRLEYLFGASAVRKILSLPPSLTERASVGSQIARLSSFEAIRDVFLSPVGVMLVEAPATLMVAIVLCIVNPAAIAVLASALLLNVLLYLWLGRSVSQNVRNLGRSATRKNEFIVEFITKMRAVREAGGQGVWRGRLRNLSAEASSAAFTAERSAALLTSLSTAVMSLAGLAMIAVSVPEALAGKLGAGGLIVSMILVWRVLTPIQTLFSNLPRLERVRAATTQFDALMKLSGEPEIRSRADLDRRIAGDIAFSRVSFRYSMEADPALLGVSVNIPRGSIVALTGATGSGKSTFMKLILGLYAPQAGSVRIDGTDIRQLDPRSLRQQIGYAPQETQLFRATILQNVRFARPDASEAEVRAALAMSGALEQVEALPKGLNYRIGDNAADQLPAGLRQAICLARAYVTDAPILLFDEPGAALDVEGDQRFMALIQTLRGRKTIVFSSHRPSHIRLADAVLTFEGGYLQSATSPEQWLAA